MRIRLEHVFFNFKIKSLCAPFVHFLKMFSQMYGLGALREKIIKVPRHGFI